MHLHSHPACTLPMAGHFEVKEVRVRGSAHPVRGTSDRQDNACNPLLVKANITIGKEYIAVCTGMITCMRVLLHSPSTVQQDPYGSVLWLTWCTHTLLWSAKWHCVVTVRPNRSTRDQPAQSTQHQVHHTHSQTALVVTFS